MSKYIFAKKSPGISGAFLSFYAQLIVPGFGSLIIIL